MVRAWCVLLLTTIPMGGLSSSSVSRQFHVVNVDKTWTEAQQYCRDEFTDLATIEDTVEMEKVNSIIQDAYDGVTWGATWGPWIGLRNGEWQWSLADESYYGDDEGEFRSWGDGQPDMKDDECCVVVIKGSNKWLDWTCDSYILFVCYDATNSTHPFVLVEESKPWAEAQTYCREKYTDLASVRNQEENAIMGSFYDNVWVGLFRNDWEWSDGSNPSTFRHWLPGSPSYEDDDPEQDGLCAEIWSSGRWNDRRCDALRRFVCYEAQPTVVVVSPPQTSPFYSGDVVTLRCDITEYTDQQQQYVWLKDNSPVAGETSQTIAITLPGQYWCHRPRDNSSVSPYISDPVDIVFTGPRVTQVVRVVLKVLSGVNVEDSGLQAAILREIGLRLKATGMPASQLTWRKTQP